MSEVEDSFGPAVLDRIYNNAIGRRPSLSKGAPNSSAPVDERRSHARSLLLGLYARLSEDLVDVDGFLSVTQVKACTPVFVTIQVLTGWRAVEIIAKAPVALPVEDRGEKLREEARVNRIESMRTAEELIAHTIDVALDCEGDWMPSMVIGGEYQSYRKDFQRVFGSSEGILWSKVLENMPRSLAIRFYYGIRNHELCDHHPSEQKLYVTGRLHKLGRDLKSRLDELRPDTFDVGWLQVNCADFYQQMFKLKKHLSQFSWYRFIKVFASEWIVKFHPKFSFVKDEDALSRDDRVDYLEQKKAFIERRWSEMKGRALVVLEEKNPEEFTTGWLIKNGGRSITTQVNKLIKQDPELNWHRFVLELGSDWIDRFKWKKTSLADCAVEWDSRVMRKATSSWSIKSIKSEQRGFWDAVRHMLKKEHDSYDWGHFFALLSRSTMDTYDEDEDNGVNAKKKSSLARAAKIRRETENAAQRINDAVVDPTIQAWSFTSLGNIDPDLYSGVKALRRYLCFSDCLPLLSDLALDKMDTVSVVMQRKVFAEKIGRSLQFKAPGGWRLTDIPDADLQASAREMKGHFRSVLAHMSDALRVTFISGPVRNEARKIVKQTLDLDAVHSARVDEILKQHAYSETGKISWQLLMDLKNEILSGNSYAALITESIIEFFLAQEGVSVTAIRGRLCEIVFSLGEGRDLSYQIIRKARSFTRISDLSLETPKGPDGWTLGGVLGVY